MQTMEFKDYEALIEELAEICATTDQAPQDLLESLFAKDDPRLLQAVKLRAYLSDGVDAQRVEGLLVTGLFSRFQRDDRVGAFLFCFEVGDAAEQLRFERRFAPYRESDPLFQFHPKLLQEARELELIPRAALGKVYDDGTVLIDGGFARLERMLAPSIVHTLAEAFCDADIYLRLDPEVASKKRPQQMLLEAVMVPANPRWWRNLGLRNNQVTGGNYKIIEPASPQDDIASYIEYHVRGFRKLETITSRRKPKYLTTMLEELEQRGDQLLIGRCIHLDTEAPFDTAPGEAKLNHLDLAINVYSGPRVKERLEAQMNDAEKVKTAVRTHLLRIEGVPVQILPLLCLMFFKSHRLRLDLFGNQFIDISDSGEHEVLA